ncbi:MAG: hypothetical protein OXH47_08930 [Paracoccaceae bacterium]|nr:hypothetical protein [Paracoccaceae bacterium]
MAVEFIPADVAVTFGGIIEKEASPHHALKDNEVVETPEKYDW